MAAKSPSPPAPKVQNDHEQLLMQVKAFRSSQMWAGKCVALEAAGNQAAAAAARIKAYHHMQRMIELATPTDP
jgi:hypothetical protein